MTTRTPETRIAEEQREINALVKTFEMGPQLVYLYEQLPEDGREELNLRLRSAQERYYREIETIARDIASRFDCSWT